jgi:hypothetical protein
MPVTMAEIGAHHTTTRLKTEGKLSAPAHSLQQARGSALALPRNCQNKTMTYC